MFVLYRIAAHALEKKKGGGIYDQTKLKNVEAMPCIYNKCVLYLEMCLMLEHLQYVSLFSYNIHLLGI